MAKFLGSFQAQFFAFLSFDPNTIFHFFVFDDRVVLLKVGSALNQLPQLLSHGLVEEPVMLRDVDTSDLPDLSTVQELVRQSGPPSREILLSDIVTANHRRRGVFSRGLHLVIKPKNKLFFRFLSESQSAASQQIMKAALGRRYNLLS